MSLRFVRTLSILSLASVALFVAAPAHAAGALSVEIVNGYNLVVDSNVTSPSTYGPASAYIGAKVCNTGDASLSNVFINTGNYNAGVGSTPGVFPVLNSTGYVASPQITNTGNYSLTIEADDTGAADGSRYIGTLAAGQCRTEYWLISYPQCVNVSSASDAPPCTTSITGGIKPDDDVKLSYDVWATTTTAIAAPSVSSTRQFTLRNEISAAANKIWPNTSSKVPDAYLAAIQSVIGWGTLGPDGQPLSASNPVYPGQRVITTQGIWYDLGNVGAGFDNNGDLVPDQNAWLQPVGDPSAFDADCFRMVNVYGILIVKLKTGGELLIPFQNQLYFQNLPDNTGVVGLVYYQFIATDQGCTAAMTPYQEAASGFDNEKFSADFGLSNGLTSGTFGVDLGFTKTDGTTSTTTGSTLTYSASSTNNTGVPLGAPDYGVPMVITDAIPAGTTYVAGSADDSPNTNLTEPTGTGSYTQDYTDLDGNVDTCTINYNITSSQYVILYSTNGGTVWTTTEPAPASVTNIKWLLLTSMTLDGGHNGTACLANDGLYDNGSLETSLPPGKNFTVRFQVTVNSNGGPVVCNTAGLTFGGSSPAQTAQDCTVITGNNTLSGNVFADTGVGTGGIFANGAKDGTEPGIGAGVSVTLYYDFNGNGEVDSADIQYATTTTSATGAYSFSTLADGPYLVVVKKYDGATSDGINNAATDAAFGTTGYGSTTYDPNLPLTTTQGILKLNETLTLATMAVNIDLPRANVTAQSVTNVNFGFAPPFRITKTVALNPDTNADGRADTAIDEGDVFNYSIQLENRLPSVGKQGPTGCQYTVWAGTGANGTPASKEFTNPANAWDGPNRNVASVFVTGGGNSYMDGSNFTLADQSGNITKVEALTMGYFASTLSDDNLTLTLRNSATFTSSTTTFNTALIDSYVGEPATLDPDSAISWDVTAARPGGGTWSWTDDFTVLRLEVNPSKSTSADQKFFYLDAIGLRITTDQDCEAGPSTTLSPVPLQDSYDTGSVVFVSATPAPDSIDTATGVLRWNDVGPILPGSSATVNVTMRALNITGTRTGSCGVASPPTTNSTCNWAETAWGGNNVKYLDGRAANDGSSKIAVTFQGRGEIRGSIWKDTDSDGWPIEVAEPKLPNVSVTLYGCVRSDGVTMETTAGNKTCAAQTGGNFWKALATTTTDANGAYEFIGLNQGNYIVEVGDTDGAPGTGNASPYGGTQRAEPTDTQTVTGSNANGATCGTCNNTWGTTTLDLNQMNQIVGEEIINGVNFGYNIPSAVLYGNVWQDLDGDATQDANDSGLTGFTVRRYSDPNGDGNIADGTLQATTTTDANGNYSFSGLAAGNYVIVVVPPTLLNKSWSETVETTGGTSSLNNQIPVTIVAGAISGSHNFGYTQRDTSSIGDTLYFDLDSDGLQDATEDGIPNVTVWLYEDVDRDGTIDDGVDELIATTATSSTGTYLFSSLPAGSYVVKVDTSDPDFPSDVTATGDPDVAAASIGDTIWLDSNGNGVLNAGEDGIARVVVNLYADTDGSGTLTGGDSLVASTVTNTNGNYLFTGLSAGNYFVDVDETTLPSTSLALTTTDPASTLITLAASTIATQNLNADAGYSLASNFSIGNRLWHDVDNDGVQDAGEPGIPNVTITVTNGTGTGCAGGCTVSTDAGGFWIVTGLTNGTFNVTVDTNDLDFPRFFTPTTGTTNPRVPTVAGADLTNVDFGYRYTGSGTSPTGTISGRIFQDADADLSYDAGEERASTTVNLLDSEGNIVATTLTNGTGQYSFNGVFVGQYSVESVDRLGTRYSTLFLSAAQTLANLNIIYQSTTETTADSQSSVSVDGVHANLLQDFGYRRFLGTIGDSIFWDTNENGTQDIGEPGFANVTVRLYDAVWTDANNDGFFQAGEATTTLVDTTSTIADNPLTTANEGGTYLFQNLPALASGHSYLVVADTTTLPGASHTLISDPDGDGTPCTALPLDGIPASVCDSQKLVIGFAYGNNYLGADFGYRVNGTNYATIGDSLWIDSDGDGVKDSGEVGIDAVTVWLDTDNDGVVDWTDGNGNGVWDSGEGERWVVTDPDGFYVFTGVSDGTYNLKVLTSDPDWPSGLSTTPTYEARLTNTASRNNAVQVVVSSGAVSSIVDGDGATTDACSSCNLNVDFGYRYAGTNSVMGTVCVDDPSKNGYCGATATTYSGVDGANESSLAGITVTAYRWTDDGDNSPWAANGTLDAGDAFVVLGNTSTDANGDYSFSNLPDNVVFVFSVNDSQNLRLTTTNANTSVEDANVLKRALYEGTSTYNGNTVTVLGRQALSMGGDTDDIIRDLDWAFDATLGGLLAYDFGDLPTSYANTLLANSGAQQLVTGGSIHLGSTITTENDGKPDSTASLDGGDDGVAMVSTVFGTGYDGNGSKGEVDVTASAAGWIAAWIDFNGDGDFNDTDELILDESIASGLNHLYFYIPGTIPNGVTNFYSRFRIYPSRPQIVASTGSAFDSTFNRMAGEVEDYLFVMSVTPTEVEMATIDAVQNKKGVTLTWNTTSETDNLGFHVYRQVAGGEKEKLNPHIITGSAFVNGRKVSGPRSYRFIDRKPVSGFAQYYIEDIDIDGTKTLHGPVTPHSGPEEAETVITDPDPTVGSVGGIFTTAAGMGVDVPAPAAPTQKQLDEQWQLSAVQAVKVIVTQPGWYRVKKSQLLAAGYDPGTNGKAISVYTEGTEVPVYVNAKNEAQFGNDDSIEFFGRGIDTTSTGGRVYYITVKRGSGLRVKSVGAKGASGSPAPNSFATTFSRIERTVFFTALTNNGDRENFFGPVITSWPVTQNITVSNLDASGNAKLELVLQGGAENMEHVVEANLNGYTFPLIRFRDLDRYVTTLTVPASRLNAGDNNVLTLTAMNGWEDVSVLESLKLAYKHTFRADNDALTFAIAGGTAVTVKGFTTDAIRVLDVTDPVAPAFINANIANAGDGSKQVSFATTGSGTRTIFAFAENRVLAPAQVAYNEPSTWNNATNGANLIILTNRSFLAAANTLKSARIAQGYSTAVVDVQNVYDEFSYGHHSPQAIRDFLARTRSWKTVPKYAILLGDASFDPRNYLGFGSYDFVPTKLVPTAYMKTASDDWFADFTNTGIPAIAIGRIPARTPEEANAMIAKITARNTPPTGAWAQQVTIVADWPNGYPFDAAADSIAAGIPSTLGQNRISIASTPNAANAILDSFNNGSLLTNYIGHGSVELWSNWAFSSYAAQTLTNGNRLPFVVAMNCLNGYYHDLFTESLAEALLKNPNGGAIGVWASSSLSGTSGQLAVNLEFNRQVFGPTPITIGDAILRAKQASSNGDVRRTWILFGDPTMKLK
ncbi:MAG TPA: SdrD B-like domain-containing protein [Thermoanaerobaculia bacterium]|nr:SdrD B-like domain-containing protein [Thermoanaerobaculia bacterium]